MYLNFKTSVQLYNQLHKEGYSIEDIRIVQNAYQFAQHLFAFAYRPSGDTFISHLVGTASILCSQHTSVNLIVSGLLHAAYIYGDFGTIKTKSIPDTWRKRVRKVVGDEIEKNIYKYSMLKWNSQTIPTIYDNIDKLEDIDRNALLIRLANELDDNLNLTTLYCPDYVNRKQYLKNFSSTLVKMANHLGFPALGTELDKIIMEVLSNDIPDELHNRQAYNRSYIIVPRSYHKSLFFTIPQFVFTGLKHLNKLYHKREKNFIDEFPSK